MLSAIFPSIKIDLDEWKKDSLVIAEKELAEEKKWKDFAEIAPIASMQEAD